MTLAAGRSSPSLFVCLPRSGAGTLLQAPQGVWGVSNSGALRCGLLAGIRGPRVRAGSGRHRGCLQRLPPVPVGIREKPDLPDNAAQPSTPRSALSLQSPEVGVFTNRQAGN